MRKMVFHISGCCSVLLSPRRSGRSFHPLCGGQDQADRGCVGSPPPRVLLLANRRAGGESRMISPEGVEVLKDHQASLRRASTLGRLFVCPEVMEGGGRFSTRRLSVNSLRCCTRVRADGALEISALPHLPALRSLPFVT